MGLIGKNKYNVKRNNIGKKYLDVLIIIKIIKHC